MEFFPDEKTFLQIGPLGIRWYAVLIVIGALTAYSFVKKDLKDNGYDEDVADDLFVGGMLVGFSGARLWYCMFWNPEYWFSDIRRLLDIRGGGIAIQGGLIFGGLFVFGYCLYKKMNFLRTADCILPNVLVSQIIGRWGNFVNKEAYGEIVDEAMFKYYPKFSKEGMFIDGAYRQPTFLWVGILHLIGFILIRYGYKRYGKGKRGDLFALYLIWYGVVRFIIEGYRTDNLMFMGMKMSQLMGMLFAISGTVLFVMLRLVKEKRMPVILFDLDGTLLDTEPAIIETYRRLFEKYRSVEEFDKNKQVEVLGPPLLTMFKQYFPDQDPHVLEDEYRKYNKEILKDYIKPMEHASELIDYLHSEGYKVGIVSAKYKDDVKDGLDLFNLTEKFDVIIGGEEVEHDKPSPEGIIKACKAMKVSQDQLIYVGDSVMDMKAGKHAGAYSVGYVFNPGKKEAMIASKPNRLITDLMEIKDMLKEDHEWTHNMM